MPEPKLCPSCGIDWNILDEMFDEGYPSLNRGLAEAIMVNCHACLLHIAIRQMAKREVRA